MEAISVKDLTFTYPGEARPALRGVSAVIPAGSFTVICGPSGCGKTTLLRLMKPEIRPAGTSEGAVCFDGTAEKPAPGKIGYVGQRPEDQLVGELVWQELAFGAECQGMPTDAMRARVAETAAYFGMEGWYHQPTATLSGGQKQWLNLAAALVTEPEILLLDEPTARLDPVAAERFLQGVWQLHRDTGITVVMTALGLDGVAAFCDHVLRMEKGTVAFSGTPQQTVAEGWGNASPLGLPVATRVGNALGCPALLTVAQAREAMKTREWAPLPPETGTEVGEPLVTAENLWVRYEKDGKDVLRGVDFTLHRGEIAALLGENGGGKSTLLWTLAGEIIPQHGRVKTAGRVAVLPQDPRMLFLHATLREEWEEMTADREAKDKVLASFGELADRHPLDVSGGEQQRAALEKVLLTCPDGLLLDEPTKGLDGDEKAALASRLRELARCGTAILLITHDTDFAAAVADRCAFLFDGEIAAEGTPRTIFSANRFYTTSAARIARGFFPGCVRTEEITGEK